LTAKAGPQVRFGLAKLGNLAVLVFAAVLFYAAWHTVSFSKSFGMYSPGYLEMPIWIPQATMLPGAAMLGLVAIAKLFEGGPRQ
jgi:C4-dicarboxylate transporter, DctQ subunit